MSKYHNFILLICLFFIAKSGFGRNTQSMSELGYVLILSDSTSYFVKDPDLISLIPDYIDSLKYIEGEEKFEKYPGLHIFQLVIEVHLNIGSFDFNMLEFQNMVESIDLRPVNMSVDTFIYKVSDISPRFPGCEHLKGTDKEKEECSKIEMYEFIHENLRYPETAINEKIQGICVVRFVINKDGSLSYISLLRDIGGECGEESLRLVNMMNEMNRTWIPGYNEARPINFQYNLAIGFKLE